MTAGGGPAGRILWDRPRLITRGWGLVVAALILIIFGGIVTDDLIALAVVALAVVGGGLAWTSVHQPELDVHFAVHPDRIAAGGEVEIAVRVDNTGPRSSPPLRLEAAAGRLPTFAVPGLRPGTGTARTIRFPCSERGVFQLGGSPVRLADPFAVSWRRGRADAGGRIIVQPRVEVLDSLPPLGGSPVEGDLASRGFDGDELHAVREYRAGDDIRRVHWAVSARTGTLVVREYRPTPEPSLSLVLDAGGPAGEPFEVACSLCASVAARCAAAGWAVELTMAGESPRGPEDLAVILDRLAEVKVVRTDSVRLPDPTRAERGVTVVATTRPLGVLSRSSQPVVVVQATTREALPGTWEAAVAAASR